MPEQKSLAGRIADRLRDWLAGVVVLKLIAFGGTFGTAVLALWASLTASVFRRGVLLGSAGTLLAVTLLYIGAWLWLYWPRRRLEKEVEEMTEAARRVFTLADPLSFPSRALYRRQDLERALSSLMAVIASSTRFKGRVQLAQLAQELDRMVAAGAGWNELQPKLSPLKAWIEKAESDVLLKPPPPAPETYDEDEIG
jgi:cbb3-type cytochrome oxidase subunit 3